MQLAFDFAAPAHPPRSAPAFRLPATAEEMAPGGRVLVWLTAPPEDHPTTSTLLPDGGHESLGRVCARYGVRAWELPRDGCGRRRWRLE